MEKSYSESYAAAGVDITAGYRSVELMKQYVARTMNEHCIGGLGGFGGLFELDCTGYKHPVLISGTDGVGTKLKIAMIMDKHDTIGIDCVAMCVNDVICAGAKPLVFLDYIACGRNIPEKIAEIVKGVAEGCVQADCSLVGGETAEHPGMMPEEEYDLAGFTVGVVDKEKILSNETMAAGDVILALPSTGVHSNGFSLVRKIFDIDANPDVLHTAPAELGGKTLGEALLAPTKIYVKPVLKVLEEVDVKGISHITGGGICTIAADPAKLEDPSLIIYNPVLTLGKTHIVTNGDQTDTIYDLMSQGKSFADALRTRTFEPDGPNYTPRISAVVYADGSYQMSILKSADGNGDSVQRYFFDYPQPVAGEGHFISTYKHNGNPIPSFEGEPLRFACPRTIGDFAQGLWSSLNPDNKVSLFARVIDLDSGETGDMIFNKYDAVCSDLDDPEEPELLPG